MNRLKKIGAVAGLIILMAGACGCREKDTRNSAEVMRDIALEYLNENYDDTFEPESYELGGWAYDWDTVRFVPKKYPEATVSVKVYENEGEYSFTDDYFKCYMYAEAVEYYKEIFGGEISVTVKVGFNELDNSKLLDGATTFKEWREKGSYCYADVYYITKEELTEESQYDIVKQIAEDRIAGYVTFFTTTEEDLLEGLSTDEVFNNQEELTEGKKRFLIDYDFNITS